MNLGSGGDERFDAGIRARKSEYLMAGANQLSNNCGTDEACCSRHENSHDGSLA
jgi:hypothetical protein